MFNEPLFHQSTVKDEKCAQQLKINIKNQMLYKIYNYRLITFKLNKYPFCSQ